MNYLIVAIAFLAAAAGCKKAEKAAEAGKEAQQAPPAYVSDLQKDVQKAEAVAEKATAHTQELEQNMEGGESQSR